MTFAQRLFRYLIGIVIGLVVVAIMFPQRNWLNWTPQSRMMQDIREFKFAIAPLSKCSMECAKATAEHLQNARQYGQINFKKSQTHSTPKVYILEYGDLEYSLALADSTFTLQTVQRQQQTCECP